MSAGTGIWDGAWCILVGRRICRGEEERLSKLLQRLAQGTVLHLHHSPSLELSPLGCGTISSMPVAFSAQSPKMAGWMEGSVVGWARGRLQNWTELDVRRDSAAQELFGFGQAASCSRASVSSFVKDV